MFSISLSMARYPLHDPIVDAAHAIGAAGTVELGTTRVSTRRHGDIIQVRVADNGPGFPQQIRDKIFDPSLSTKEVGTGAAFAVRLPIGAPGAHTARGIACAGPRAA
jgi:nitrogen fixation/metabolism regulation signal transduction histidine kinase